MAEGNHAGSIQNNTLGQAEEINIEVGIDIWQCCLKRCIPIEIPSHVYVPQAIISDLSTPLQVRIINLTSA